MRRRKPLVLLALVGLLALIVGCGSGGDDGKTKIGFLYVGPQNDFGYNQAAYQGSQAVKKAFPDAEILQAENVPETAEAERVMERMIDRGATIIFPTSFGHLEPALNVARRHPDVTFLHQGGLKTAENVGTYFGTIYEAEYLAGQAAGMATKTNKIGFVVAFPIAQTLLNVNAFQLGARSVNPDARTTVVFTSDWCDPGKQAEATNSLLDQDADVITQHQDCTKTVIQTASRRGALTTGYHADAGDLAPDSWLTGAIWNWGPLFVDMVKTVRDGKFKGSPYAGRYRVGLKEGTVKLAEFGRPATPEIRRKVQETEKRITSGQLKPFTGPIRDQSGKERIPAGKSPSPQELEATDYFIEGVTGRIPE